METRSSPSVAVLRSLAAEAGIENVNTSKAELFRVLKSNFDLERLERVQKRRRNRMTEQELAEEQEDEDEDDEEEETDQKQKQKKQQKKKQKQQGKRKSKPKSNSSSTRKVNALVDPVMLNNIPRGAPTFSFARPNGSQVVFGAATLADYLLATGDFTEPESRIPFSDQDIEHLDEIIREHKLGRESVLSAKKDTKRYEDLKFRRDALEGLDRYIGEVVAEIYQVLENECFDEGNLVLSMRLFPAFADLFAQLKTADPKFSQMCLSDYIESISKAPKKETEDSSELRSLVLRFFSKYKASK